MQTVKYKQTRLAKRKGEIVIQQREATLYDNTPWYKFIWSSYKTEYTEWVDVPFPDADIN